MKLFIILALIAYSNSYLLRTLNLKDQKDFTLCTADDGQNVQVTDLELNNGVKGQTATIVVKGTALNDFNTSEVQVVISNTTGAPLPIPVQHFPWVNTESAGDDVTFQLDQYMPSIIPSGDYKFVLSFMDENKSSLDCVEFHHTF